jgi:hypothetical protein
VSDGSKPPSPWVSFGVTKMEIGKCFFPKPNMEINSAFISFNFKVPYHYLIVTMDGIRFEDYEIISVQILSFIMIQLLHQIVQ